MPNAPQSVAHLILKGFDYYTSRYNKRPEDILTGDQVIEAMGSVDQFRGLECVRKPAVVRSRGSKDMAVAFVDVWDSKSGSRTKDLSTLDKESLFHSARSAGSGIMVHPGVPSAISFAPDAVNHT
ncbi:hypothetical protein AGABI1DRAFT_134919 [Agaricus bisporus var. burnettii JB137-S8]|uniref:Uncharacterized protein n=1 Tax=Agaricus bisporus var. burnettii (strain JB137-S8 / ATCC MYA-4627 / FGSC 10392) TaxID=597362 RepID=K5WDP5_AGABU|nr:uncharacterized protein AGABI1DRAFT_134919 [Agaricus bisporus var. burnettii JB137-S8]EKM73371.1 hypothetical protein AGABI1DRAFT_134919 [Agaricus bisporus var. burnettii JB137-S8]